MKWKMHAYYNIISTLRNEGAMYCTKGLDHALQVGGSRFRKYLQRKICKIFSDLITRCNIAQINFFDDYYV